MSSDWRCPWDAVGVSLECAVPIGAGACAVIAAARCASCQSPICQGHARGRGNGPSCPRCWEVDPGRCCDCERVATVQCVVCSGARCLTHMATEDTWDAQLKTNVSTRSNVCSACQSEEDRRQDAALSATFPAALEHVAQVLQTRKPTAHWTHTEETKALIAPTLGSVCSSHHPDCKLLEVFRVRHSRRLVLTFGRPAFVLWEYGVVWSGERGSAMSARRQVHLLPSGSLVFNAKQYDTAESAYDAPMVELAATRPRMHFRDLRAEHFSQHGVRGFDQYCRALLASSSS